MILLVIGLVGVGLLRARPGAAYAVAIVTMLAASPVLNVNWLSLLLALVAPLAWPASATHAPPIGESGADEPGAGVPADGPLPAVDGRV